MRWSKAFLIFSSSSYFTLFALSGLRVQFIVEYLPWQSFLVSGFALFMIIWGVRNPSKWNYVFAVFFGFFAMMSFSGLATWINYFGITNLSPYMAFWDAIIGTSLLRELDEGRNTIQEEP